jgi:hypothetical protein
VVLGVGQEVDPVEPHHAGTPELLRDPLDGLVETLAVTLGEYRGRALTVRLAWQVHIDDGVSDGHPEVGIRGLPTRQLGKYRLASLRNQPIVGRILGALVTGDESPLAIAAL